MEDEDIGQIFHFTDIGYYDLDASAYERGIQWARAWLYKPFDPHQGNGRAPAFTPYTYSDRYTELASSPKDLQ